MYASTGESEAAARRGFSRLPNNVSSLKANKVKIIFALNAHKIVSHLNRAQDDGTPFDRVVCNFPCIGSSTYGKQVAMRRWIRNFLSSAKNVLAPNGQIWLTLKDGQGQHHQWQLAEQVQATALSISGTRRFRPAAGYECRRGHEWDAPFPADDGVTHIISRVDADL